MKAVIQRVEKCSVKVSGQLTGEIDRGLLAYIGIGKDDTETDIDYLADKISNLRIFDDADGKMNLSVLDLNLEIMIVSQFTLFGSVSKGRRPSFNNAAEPEKAVKMYNQFIEKIKNKGIKTACGIFRENMKVEYINDGPVTIIIDSKSGS
jgi:D-tyrosyl-tRNA(Tyr) deacylase